MVSLSREWWGPKFWLLLHTLAECAGNQQSPILSNDEADSWEVLLKAQAFVMPCALCKQHYLEWRASHRVPNLRSLLGETRRGWLRRWLCGCHNRVNGMTEKAEFDESRCPEIYKKERLDEPYMNLSEMFSIAIQRGQIEFEDTKRWKTAVARLRMLYGI